ncbi:MAG: outer membrane lipoprotein-sorting protein, partial [Thermodesulfobacteriota bacterium]|nr:outer membrane lipoprotein-sorting protein [Thermodesulfobacteriota bacterium]
MKRGPKIKNSNKNLLRLILIVLPLFFWGRIVLAVNIDDVLLKFGNYKLSVDYKGKLLTVFVDSAIPFVHKYEICNLPSASQREEKIIEGDKEVSFDDGKFLWRYLPKRNLVIQENSRLKRQKGIDPRSYLASVKKNYTIEIVDKKTILHRNAYLVLFKPKSQDRPKQLIWIDCSCGIPLRLEKYDSSGKLAIVSSFSQITIINKIDSPLNLKVPSNTNLTRINEKSNITLDQVQKIINRDIYVPEYLSSGFYLKNIVLRNNND